MSVMNRVAQTKQPYRSSEGQSKARVRSIAVTRLLILPVFYAVYLMRWILPSTESEVSRGEGRIPLPRRRMPGRLMLVA